MTDVITTPQQMLEWKAKAHRGLMPGMQFIFAEWLLEHGEEFGPPLPRKKWPKGLKLGQIKNCYDNSFSALVWPDGFSRDDWFYTEGVVLRADLPIEIDHAWLSNRNGDVLDLTLRKQKPGDSYFGVPYKWDYVRKMVLKHEYYGLFSDGCTYNKDVIESIKEGRAWKKGERNA